MSSWLLSLGRWQRLEAQGRAPWTKLGPMDFGSQSKDAWASKKSPYDVPMDFEINENLKPLILAHEWEVSFMEHIENLHWAWNWDQII